MYILVVSRGYPTDKWPLNGVFEFDQARALSEAGNKVVFAAIDMRSIRRWRKWGIEHFTKDNVEIYCINIPLGGISHRFLFYVGKLGLLILCSLIQKSHGEPDIVHAHFLSIAEIALVLKSRLKVAKFVMTEHWSLLNGRYSTFPAWVKNSACHIYNQYDSVICVSFMLANKLNKVFNMTNMVVMPNMIDPIFLSNTYKLRADSEFRFVFVGAIDSRKSPLECIYAFYEAFHESRFITTNGKKICLCLVGDGPLFSDCQYIIEELEIKANVSMMGQMTRNQIADILISSDCFVLPSKLETFGVVYIEAMSCGLPVIATRCGGPETFINEANGLLINVDDHDALVRAFRYISENRGKYNSVQIQSYARRNFSPEVIANKLVNLYRKLF